VSAQRVNIFTICFLAALMVGLSDCSANETEQQRKERENRTRDGCFPRLKKNCLWASTAYPIRFCRRHTHLAPAFAHHSFMDFPRNSWMILLTFAVETGFSKYSVAPSSKACRQH